jgi:rhodanese-related sulfurtransferase
MKAITAEELQIQLDSRKDIQLIDIREKYEFEDGHLDAINIPMDSVIDNLDKITKDKPVIIYCKSGKRASAMVYMLEKMYSFENLLILEGGYDAFVAQPV